MDESSTTSTPHAAALAELAEGCDGKLVAIGDPRQIGAVGPGGLYGHLTDDHRAERADARSAASATRWTAASSSSPMRAAAPTRSTCCARASGW